MTKSSISIEFLRTNLDNFYEFRGDFLRRNIRKKYICAKVNLLYSGKGKLNSRS